MTLSTRPSTERPNRPRRDLIARPVTALAGAVHRAPRLVLAAIMAVTAVMLVAAAGRKRHRPARA